MPERQRDGDNSGSRRESDSGEPLEQSPGSELLDEIIRATESSDAPEVLDVFKHFVRANAGKDIEEELVLEGVLRDLVRRFYPGLTMPSGLVPWMAEMVKEDPHAMDRFKLLWQHAAN